MDEDGEIPKPRSSVARLVRTETVVHMSLVAKCLHLRDEGVVVGSDVGMFGCHLAYHIARE